MSLFGRLFSRVDKWPDERSKHENPTSDTFTYSTESEKEADPRFSGIRIGIVYVDQSGARSRRVIRVLRVDGHPSFGYVAAFCELRKERRTFLVDRIQELYDPSTGEIAGTPADYFAPFLEQNEAEDVLSFEKRKFRNAWSVIEKLRPELQVLVLVARADGRFVKAEQELILKYAAERMLDLGEEVDDRCLVVLRDWLKLQDPSEPEIRIALKSLRSTPSALEALWEVPQLVAEADRKVRPEELDTIEIIKAEIASL